MHCVCNRPVPLPMIIRGVRHDRRGKRGGGAYRRKRTAALTLRKRNGDEGRGSVKNTPRDGEAQGPKRRGTFSAEYGDPAAAKTRKHRQAAAFARRGTSREHLENFNPISKRQGRSSLPCLRSRPENRLRMNKGIPLRTKAHTAAHVRILHQGFNPRP